MPHTHTHTQVGNLKQVLFIYLFGRFSLTIVIVQSLSRIWFFVTQWTAAHQAFLSFTIFRSLLKLMSVESVMSSNHFILCYPLLLLPSIFPSIKVFSFIYLFFFSKSFLMSQFFASGGQSTGGSASTLVLPMNIQDWFPLEWTGWTSLKSNGLWRVF